MVYLKGIIKRSEISDLVVEYLQYCKFIGERKDIILTQFRWEPKILREVVYRWKGKYLPETTCYTLCRRLAMEMKEWSCVFVTLRDSRQILEIEMEAKRKKEVEKNETENKKGE